MLSADNIKLPAVIYQTADSGSFMGQHLKRGNLHFLQSDGFNQPLSKKIEVDPLLISNKRRAKRLIINLDIVNANNRLYKPSPYLII
jgi:hypothetical protein